MPPSPENPAHHDNDTKNGIDEALKSGLLQSCSILNTFCENAGEENKFVRFRGCFQVEY